MDFHDLETPEALPRGSRSAAIPLGFSVFNGLRSCTTPDRQHVQYAGNVKMIHDVWFAHDAWFAKDENSNLQRTGIVRILLSAKEGKDRHEFVTEGQTSDSGSIQSQFSKQQPESCTRLAH